MARVGSLTVQKVINLLAGSAGLPANVAAIAAEQSTSVPAFPAEQVVAQNVAFEIVEKSAGAQYPVVHVYTEKVSNLLREKFRTFSGEAQMTAEVRVSQDRLEGVESQLQLYVDALTQVLDQGRGDLGDGVFYAGGYEVSYSPVKHGGRNFLQTAKVTFTVDISSN
ncbi:MAG: hypothetical protein ACRD4P_08935 [Bryobacteraceae bacterium]|nr:hypothetical protein [Bryobacteraceae bacterium]